MTSFLNMASSLSSQKIEMAHQIITSCVSFQSATRALLSSNPVKTPSTCATVNHGSFIVACYFARNLFECKIGNCISLISQKTDRALVEDKLGKISFEQNYPSFLTDLNRICTTPIDEQSGFILRQLLLNHVKREGETKIIWKFVFDNTEFISDFEIKVSACICYLKRTPAGIVKHGKRQQLVNLLIDFMNTLKNHKFSQADLSEMFRWHRETSLNYIESCFVSDEHKIILRYFLKKSSLQDLASHFDDEFSKVIDVLCFFKEIDEFLKLINLLALGKDHPTAFLLLREENLSPAELDVC
jgi:hypothetical protein